jgi:hypothetical protein
MTDVRTTQTSVEQWVTATDVPAQVTQVALEQWATVSSGTVQAIVTQVALEQWAVITASAPTARQNAVTVISG